MKTRKHDANKQAGPFVGGEPTEEEFAALDDLAQYVCDAMTDDDPKTRRDLELMDSLCRKLAKFH